MNKLRENANYTGAFIVENSEPRHLPYFTGMRSLWLKQCLSQRKAKKDTKKLGEIRRKGEYFRNIKAICNSTTVSSA